MQAIRTSQDTRSFSTSDPASPIALTPMTGRDEEVALLQRLWAQVKSGSGRAVLISGEPGLGKSRLVHSLMEHSQASQPEPGLKYSPVVEWRCAQTFQNTGLHPAVEFFEHLLDFHTDDPATVKFDRLVEHLDQFELARPDVVPLFATLLSLPIDSRFPLLGLSPARERQEIFRALRRWFRIHSNRRPILFIVEDLHWADMTTLEFLEQFICSSHGDKLLTVLTYRPEFQPSWPSVVDQLKLPLNHLTLPQVGDLVRKKIGVTSLPKGLVEQVFARAEGVPLFVEEVAQAFKDSGLLQHAAAARPEALARLIQKIPSNLRDLIVDRLDRMELQKEVAQIASTLGREFSYEMLSAVTALEATDLQSRLTRLVQAEILRARGRPPRCTYFFKHALVEDAIYSSLKPALRLEIHRRVAQALRTGFPGIVEKQPELMAHHLTAAGLTAEAIEYWLRAGLRSQARAAEKDAISHLKKGLHFLRTLPPSTARDQQELQFLLPLATAIQLSRGYSCDEALQIYERARVLCESTGVPRPPFSVTWGLWAWNTVRGNHPASLDRAREALKQALDQNDPGMTMETLFMMGVSQFFMGNFGAARDQLQHAITNYDDRARTKIWSQLTGHNSGITTRAYLALSYWFLGFPERALAINREMNDLAERLGDSFSLSYACHHTCFLLFQCRMGNELRTSAERLSETASGIDFHWYSASGAVYNAVALLLEGRVDEAIPQLRKGIDAHRVMGSELYLPRYLGMLGDAYTRSGHFAEAHAVIDEALELIQKNNERADEAEILRLQGELLRAEAGDRTASAEESFQKAIATARAQGAKVWELRATASLARLWQPQDDRTREAYQMLRAVYESFTEGFATPDLIDAAVLLAELKGAKGIRPTTSASKPPPKVGA